MATYFFTELNSSESAVNIKNESFIDDQYINETTVTLGKDASIECSGLREQNLLIDQNISHTSNSALDSTHFKVSAFNQAIAT